MGKPTGFIEIQRKGVTDRDPASRLKDFKEFHLHMDEATRQEQGARCMDCGVPFCQSDYGCPVDNLIPEWNDLVYHGRWEEAWKRLMKTNNFPEYTGRVCPAPCEHACVLGINEPPVTIKDNEAHIIDRAYDNGLMQPRIPTVRTGKRVVVVGSGPSGLSAADQLNQAGHHVTVLERADRIGGLLMYGIPNMKLDKEEVVERRNRLMAEEGVEFRTGVNVGVDVTAEELAQQYDAVLLCTGATKPRDLPVPGRELRGVHFAMEFLTASQKRLFGVPGYSEQNADIPYAEGKHVIVIGGGDTGTDCTGTALRQGAKSVTAFEIMPKPPSERTPDMPWPTFARIYKQDYAQQEAQEKFGSDPRQFSIMTKEFVDRGDGAIGAVRTVRVKWEKEPGERPKPVEVPGSEEEWPADLVTLAMGFLGPEDYVPDELGLSRDARSNIAAAFEDHRTSMPGVYAAGDARRGQSLVVWAIKEGRMAAREVDRDLMGKTLLT
ncbi:MAG: glutamate synthase subunit beta [Spirochaetales bacterium]